MKTRMHHRIVLAIASVMLASAALAADPPTPAPADPSPERRHQMAEIYQRMADCLISTRPIAECRGEMQKSCQDVIGKDGCTMMNGHMGGMMQGQGMGTSPAAPAQKAPSGSHEEHH
jgi:hypothetical protein